MKWIIHNKRQRKKGGKKIHKTVKEKKLFLFKGKIVFAGDF